MYRGKNCIEELEDHYKPALITKKKGKKENRGTRAVAQTVRHLLGCDRKNDKRKCKVRNKDQRNNLQVIEITEGEEKGKVKQ